MSIMLNTKISNTLTKNMANGDRFRIAKEFQFFVELITKLKSDPFHHKTPGLIFQRTNH